MAFLLLVAAFLATLLGAPAVSDAAPSVDTWVLPSPPRVDWNSPFFYDAKRRQVSLVDLEYRATSKVWSLPDSGARAWALTELSPVQLERGRSMRSVYDAKHDRLLLVSARFDPGDSCCSEENRGRFLFDPWELLLSEPAQLRRIEPVGPVALGRQDFALALDPVRNRLLIFGGRDPISDSLMSEVFALDLTGTPRWSVLPFSGDRLRRGFAQCFVDSLADRLIAVGGHDGVNFGNHWDEVWSLSLAGPAAWESWALADTLPDVFVSDNARSIVLDEARRRLLLYAGYRVDGAPDSAGLWQFDLATRTGWTEITPPGPLPRARGANCAAFDERTGALYLYGGYGRDTPEYSEERYDLYELAGTAGARWNPIALSGATSTIGDGGQAVFDRSRRRAITLSPFIGTSWINLGVSQDWERNENTSPNPIRRFYSAAVFDSVGDRTILFGGMFDTAEFGDVWQLTFPSGRFPAWKRLFPEGEPPSGRWATAAVLDPVRRRMVVFGGFAGRALGETWALSLAGTPRWERLQPRGLPPPARFGATAVYDSRRDGMIVFGGNAGSLEGGVPLNDTWFLSFADGDSWIPLTPRGSPPLARSFHSAVYDPLRDRMLVFWGRDAGGYRFDCAALELAPGPTWREYIPAGPGARSRGGHVSFYDPDLDRVVILGGAVASSPYEFLREPEWYLDLAATGGVLPPPTTGPAFAMLGMTPNPTSVGVDVAFDLPTATPVKARIYDTRGRLVKDLGTRVRAAGRHILHWDGNGEGGYRPRPGIYFARIFLGDREFTGKIVLTR